MAAYRILSVDGGGVRGLLASLALARLGELRPGFLANTDLLAGTSTGALVALGLASGLSPTDLVNLYRRFANTTFKDSRLDNITDAVYVFGARYNTSPRHDVLKDVFGERTLGSLERKVLIPTFHLFNRDKGRWKPKFFHNFDGSDYDGDERVLDVAMYTTAAPTYFPSFRGYIDGGVVMNNPSMAAVALTQDQRCEMKRRPKLDDLLVLSVGTGSEKRYIEGENLDWGMLSWAPHIVSLMMDGSVEIPHYQCMQILNDRYHRMQHRFARRRGIDMDDIHAMKYFDAIMDTLDDMIEDAAAWLDRGWLTE